MPRLLSAVAGYVERFGSLPSHVLVPHANWVAYRRDPQGVPASYNRPLTLAVFASVTLIPAPDHRYVAIGADGRFFDYDLEEVVGDAEAILWRSLGSNAV